MKTKGLPTGLMAFSFLLAGWTVLAQEIPRKETVKSRPKPELDATGIRVGGFDFFPKASISFSYDDNIMSKDSGEISDLITEYAFSPVLKSNWSLHFLKLSGDVKMGRYQDSGAENYLDYTLGIDGRYDFSKGFSASSKAKLVLGHEGRSSPDDANGIKPTDYKKTSFDGSIKKTINKASINGGVKIDIYDYDDVQSTTGLVNNDDRDRSESSAHVRLGYQFSPDYEWFTRLEVNNRNYNDDIDDNGYNRDSNGYELTSGISFSITGITFGNAFLGYRRQSFKDSGLITAKGFSGGFDLTWNATTISTVKADFKRTVEETTSTGASGVFRNKLILSLDHELLRNMIVSNKLTLTKNDYVGIERSDDEMKYGFTIDYQLFRNLNTTFEYKYSWRQSDAAGSAYRKNVFMLKVTARL